jgi:hypothetical protein
MWVLTSRPGCFTPGRETWYPLYRRLGGPPRPVCRGSENLALTGIRSPGWKGTRNKEREYTPISVKAKTVFVVCNMYIIKNNSKEV